MNADLTVIILTHDEEVNLPHAFRSLAPLEARIVVVDSWSADGTAEIARGMGCEVVEHAFSTQAEQLNWALDHVQIDTPWIMRIDADERLTTDLAEELLQVVGLAPEDVTGFEVKRRVYFWGRWIRHGGHYPTWLLRVWRRGTARSELRWMDEHMVSSKGTIEKLKNDIIDENHKGLAFWVSKHNRYADREVKELLRGGGGRAIKIVGQAGRKRWLKQNVYLRAPLFVRALAYWFYRYFLRLGFMDGIAGFVFHFNQGLWYRLLVDAKLYEARLAATNSVGRVVEESAGAGGEIGKGQSTTIRG